MKKLIIATIISLFVIGMAVSAYAVEVYLYTDVEVNVGNYWSWSLIDDDTAYRSTDSIIFYTVDGTSPSGWYYNAEATIDPSTGDPTDIRADVGISVKTNAPFQLSIEKTAGDDLDGKLGYHVNDDSAHNWNGTASVDVPGEILSSGFFPGETDTWGILQGTTMIYNDTVGNGYADFSMGVSFALVPGDLAEAGSPYSTIITYTLNNAL